MFSFVIIKVEKISFFVIRGLKNHLLSTNNKVTLLFFTKLS